MQKYILILTVLLCLGCRPVQTSYISDTLAYGDLNNGYPTKDTLVYTLNQSDTLAYGKYAIRNDAVYEKLKTGHWKTFHPNGTVKHEGKYKIGSYVECCTAGHCARYYHYKWGVWKHYKEDGSLLYELNYQPDELHIDTNCQGGDKAPFGLIKNFSYLEYRFGLTPDDVFQLQKVEMEDVDMKRKILLVPISGELVFLSIKE